MESPSARRRLGVGAALSGLPAAGGCFCAALLLALIADSEPGAVYARAPWLGAAVAAAAVCAFAATLGWVTLQRGGLPVLVLLGVLAVAGVPFALPGRLFLPGAAAALVACAGLVAHGLARPPASPHSVQRLASGLAAAAVVLAIGQAIAVGLQGSARPLRAGVRESRATLPSARTTRDRSKDAHDRGKDATQGSTDAPDPNLREATPPPVTAPAGAEHFVRDYYAALDARRFAVAWGMLAPGLRSAFGDFVNWRRGYARTVANTVSGLRVRSAGAGATVGLTLRAGDRDACGRTVLRRFAVTWQLVRTDAGWLATAAAARALSGATPAAVC